MATPLPDALRLLSSQFEGDGQPLLAIKCLYSCLNQAPVPAEEIEIKINLARLLQAHVVDGLSQAKPLLQSAHLVAQKLPKLWVLKCELAAQLGRVHRALGEHGQQRQAYAWGLLAATAGLTSADRSTLVQWAAYFHARSADACVFDDRLPCALEALEQGLAFAAQHGLARHALLLRLFQLQLWVMTWDRPRAEAALPEAAAHLEALAPELQAREAAQLRLHLALLRAMFLLRCGQLQQLAAPAASMPEGAPAAALEELRALLAGSEGAGAAAYEWTPRPALAATVALLSASVLAPLGRMRQALGEVEGGLATAERALAALGVGVTTREGGIPQNAVWDVRLALVLQLLLLCARAQLRLQRSEFAAARGDVAANIATLERFPVLLRLLRPAVHAQAGLYAQALGAHPAAAAHFARIQAASSCVLAKAAAACLQALSWLSLGGPDAAGRAASALGALVEAVPPALGYAERALAGLASALLKLRQGDSPAAKQGLAKVLKVAHGRLQDHQLVAATLLCMAPLQLQSLDREGALQMATSAFTLAKSAGDLHAQVGALQAMQALHTRDVGAGGAAAAAEAHNYLLRKQDELSARLQEAEAGSTQMHAAVLAWDVG